MAVAGISEAVVERARPADAACVARFLAAMHDPSELGFTIWASPRIARYVQDRMEGELPEDAPAFSVVRRGGEPAGAIHLRTIGGEIFIDGVYTDPSARKDQLSNLLVYRALIDYGRNHPAPWVAFDGLESKAAVRAWQRRILGAVEVRRRSWWRVPLPPAGAEGAIVSGLEEADESHRRWGFSRFQVTTSRGAYSIGRLPAPFFRLEDCGGVGDPELLGALARIDPARELCVTGDDDWKAGTGSRIDTLIRSHVEYPELLRRLKAQIPASQFAHEGATPSRR